MTSSRLPSDYHTSNEFTYKNNTSHQNYSQVRPNNTGIITNKTKNGSYNIVEKDFGDHKVIYHIPIEYGDDYDISQLENEPIVDEQPQIQNSPRLVRRRIYQQYQDYDDDDYEYVEEIPIETPRRRVYVSPRRGGDTQVVTRVYESQAPIQTVEYIYEDDDSDVYDYRPENEEEVEYIVRERVPKQTYMEEPRPIRRTVYVEDPSIPVSSPRTLPPPPPPPPVYYSPRRSPHQPSPHTIVNHKSPSPAYTRPPIRQNEISPPLSTRKQQTTRSPPIYEPPPPVRPNIPTTTEPPLRLMDIIAQNRARRGTRIPKPRREVDEETIRDPPTYNRNIIKNGFIVHK